jgi:hypothetical protein
MTRVIHQGSELGMQIIENVKRGGEAVVVVHYCNNELVVVARPLRI